MAAKPPDAFLSYTRFDDRHDRGAITQFRLRLANAVRAVTGAPFEIFQDVDDIDIGERWSATLDEMLVRARFFIPILTPSYFQSKACRDELEKFLKAEERAGRKDLILPIYYIQCAILEEEEQRRADHLASTIHGRQRWDWRDLRHDSLRNRKVRLQIEALAEAIGRARRMRGGQSPAPASAAASPVSLLKVRDTETGAIAPSATMPPMPASPGAAASGKVAATRPVAPPSPTDLREQALARASDQARRSGLPQASEPPPAVPGRVFRDIDAPWCPEMLEVPAGQFMMGSTDGDTKAHEGEKPQHLVRIGHRLAVGRYPVTFEEYDHFCRSTKRQVPKDRSWGRGRRPVILVSWEDSRAYAEWLRHKTGQHYRLLSEAEWEYACRAGTTTRYWWGDEITPANANFGQNVGRTSEVGAYPANAWGLFDMHGNVREWVEDRWHDNYEGAPDDGSAWAQGKSSGRVARDGAWYDSPSYLRAACRNWRARDFRHYNLGFRAARTLTP